MCALWFRFQQVRVGENHLTWARCFDQWFETTVNWSPSITGEIAHAEVLEGTVPWESKIIKNPLQD
jgi:hypothetical protein